MKKVILVIGIITQSYFGLSQKIEIVKQTKFQPKYWNSINALTSDYKNNTYAISTNTRTSECWLITYNSRTLYKIREIKIHLPETTYDEIKCSKYADGITYDNGYLWVAFPAKQKIYKINPYSGKVIKSIPGPPIIKVNNRYDGLDFDGEYFWIIRNVPKPILFKLSKTGKIINEYIIPCNYVCGLDYVDGFVWVQQLDDKNNRILSKFSLSTNSFVENYFIDKSFGVPNSIDFKNDYAYVTTSYLSTFSIYKIKLIKE
jgi:hypothetical protein